MNEIRDRGRIYEGKYPHLWFECKTKEQAEQLLNRIESTLKLEELIEKEISRLRTIHNNFPTDIQTDHYKRLLEILIESRV